MALDQEGYRWYEDNAAPDTASVAANQDTPLTLALDTPRQLRVLINPTVADVPNSYYRLEYKKSTDSTWKPVMPDGTGGEAVTLSPSANIAANGATATTARLTAPSGKTTGNFQASFARDDTNGEAVPFDFTDETFYTEMVWCVKAVSGIAQASDQYEFRVTNQTVISGGGGFSIETGTQSAKLASTNTVLDIPNFTITNANLLIVGISVHHNIPATIVSVVWDPSGVNQSLSLISGATSRRAFSAADIYSLATPTPGANKIVRVTVSDTTFMAAGATGFIGANTSSFGTAATNQGFSDTPTVAFNVASGEIGYAFTSCYEGDGVATQGSENGTLLWEQEAIGVTPTYSAGAQTFTTVNPTASWTLSVGGNFDAVGVAIKPA